MLETMKAANYLDESVAYQHARRLIHVQGLFGQSDPICLELSDVCMANS